MISGTTGAECTPKTWSETVRAQGRNVVRHDDEWWMNHRNTYGRPYYTKDVSAYSVPETRALQPMMVPPSLKEDMDFSAAQATPAVSMGGNDASLYNASVVEVTPTNPGFPFGPQQYQQGRDATGALIEGLQGLAPDKDETWQEYLQRPLYNIGIKKSGKHQGAVRTTGLSPTKPGQICSEERRLELEAEKDQAIDNVFTNPAFISGNKKKLANVSCGDLQKKIDSSKKTLAARQKIQDECFAGTGKGHQKAIDETKQGIDNLERRYADQCGPNVVPGV